MTNAYLCGECGAPLTVPKTRGGRPRYCSPEHAKRAQYRRSAAYRRDTTSRHSRNAALAELADNATDNDATDRLSLHGLDEADARYYAVTGRWPNDT